MTASDRHGRAGQIHLWPMGITGQLFTDAAKSNRVAMILEIPDMEAFQQPRQSQAGIDAMKHDGVRPER